MSGVRRLVALALVVASVVMAVAPARAQDSLAAARQAVADARDEIAATQERADAAGTAYYRAVEQLDALAIEITDVQSQVDTTRAELEALRVQVQRLAVDSYIDNGDAESLLSAADLTVRAREAALVRFVTGVQVDVLDEYRATKVRFELAEEELEVRLDRQAEIVTELEERRDDVFAELEELEAGLLDLENALAVLEEEERRRQNDEAARAAAEERARLEAAREAAAANAAAAASTTPGNPTPPATAAPADTPPPAATPDGSTARVDGGGTGPTPASTPPPVTPAPTATPVPAPPSPPPQPASFVCPVAGPSSFVDSWGAPRSGGRGHQGVDMIAAIGVPVVAVVNGTVSHRDNSVGGMSAHLVADNGDYYYYTHLSGYASGGYVAQGTVIGYVGQTGNATIPHLHFEYHPGGYGNPVNPYPVVRPYC